MSESHASDTPRVSVIMATYNWAPVLPFSIGSVLDQTFTDFELLVVGDACTDESEAVVTAIDDPRVRWINLPVNTGHQSGPNNEGLRRSTGGVVAYLGHDDLWLPHHLEVLVPVIASGHAAAHSRWLYVGPERRPKVMPSEHWSYRTGEWIPPVATAFSRRALLDAGDWRPPTATGTMDPEAELMARISERAGPPASVRRVTCVKLPAGVRRDVYRDRPHHEQAQWLEAIRQADDPEAAVQAGIDAERRGPTSLRRALGGARRWPGRVVRRRAPEPKPEPETAVARYARLRKYKGL